jgi:hypothetical protein
MRVQRYGTSLALAAAAVAVCAGCGGGGAPASGGNTPPQAATASSAAAPGGATASQPGAASGGGTPSSTVQHHPCLLITQAEARAIIGQSVDKPRSLGLTCAYSSANGDVNVDIDFQVLPLNVFTPIANLENSAPAAGVGHQAICGPDRGGGYTLLGTAGPDDTLEINGPSCAVDARFATRAYARL